MSNENKYPGGFNLGDITAKITKGNKVAGIIISIAVLVIGILLFIAPLRSLIALEYFAGGVLIVIGVFRLISYCRIPKGTKNSWQFVNSILSIIIGLLIVMQGPAAVAGTFAFLFGFMALFNGITRLSAISAVKEAGGPYGWAIASGIIDIVLSAFFICAPFMTQWIFAIITGIYLSIGGIVMLIDFCGAKTK